MDSKKPSWSQNLKSLAEKTKNLCNNVVTRRFERYSFQYAVVDMSKKGDFENPKIQKSQIAILVLNQAPISTVFPIVWFAGDQKTALTGEAL